MTAPGPATVNLRIDLRDGRTIGIDYLAEGFASTVPCTHRGCFMAAHTLCYDLSDGGTLWRRCREHMDPELVSWLQRLTDELLAWRDG